MNEKKIEAVIKAWNDAGPAPRIHEAAKEKLKKDWPALYKAVKELSEDL